jgi:hypothetical protein
MKLRAFFVALAIVAVALLTLNSRIAPDLERTKAAPRQLASAPPRTAQNRQDPAGTIDGARHPELIPDRSAYSVFFILLANRTPEEERTTIRSYLARFDPSFSDADIGALIAAANEYRQRVGVLDRQVKIIKDKNWPNPRPSVMQRLKVLQGQKEAIGDEVSASLQKRVSPKALNVIKSLVLPHIKSRIKITPDPKTPPGGPEWQPRGVPHQHRDDS